LEERVQGRGWLVQTGRPSRPAEFGWALRREAYACPFRIRPLEVVLAPRAPARALVRGVLARSLLAALSIALGHGSTGSSLGSRHTGVAGLDADAGATGPEDFYLFQHAGAGPVPDA